MAVGQRDTRPEMAIRRLPHRSGYGHTLHCRDLPGRPDLVFAPRPKVVFVHGGFLHGHRCRKGRQPKSRVAYWSEKIDKDRVRDARNINHLRPIGWATCIVSRCKTSDHDSLKERLVRFLDGDST